MPLNPERAREVLPLVDPGRLRWGWPVGLRDGALLALVAAGLTTEELVALQATAITMDRGTLRVDLPRHGQAWSVNLTVDLASRLLAWLTERRIWATAETVFTGIQGPLTPMGIHQVLHRYRCEKRASQ